jgi:hypothetical protein
MIARVLLMVFAVSIVAPAVAAGQGATPAFFVQGAVGTHIRGGGDTESVSAGFTPRERWDFLIGAERSHLPTELNGLSATRGGTTTFISGEVRFTLVTSRRLSPYVLASIGRGVSRPNVNDRFPDAVSNDAWLLFYGGGVRVPLTRRFSAFAEGRAGIQGERDVIALLLPIRVGVAWRF